ncbi:GNAT family N-acetyltransferase [Asaia bogorensis]|uniref:N-acetyltransferase YedL n=1 Tax=Asaia bogorensis NBRC 16594 TaxID=1231624 RepID=A0AAN4R4L2_9PROT|nr:GNAT family N-acetyltransferase [Asaia bogorensis]BAT18627.1 acetyltransferase [Asaia bogorensis NBRC 16594]GBQ75349.1 N-acetyltransferase GCN5 [Asaia bogorensis NBRC 16594]GEL52981.1 putative N-acetyltransferase YedL [Asaia bogorensis NBRC 16594]
MEIGIDDLSSAESRALLALHLSGMAESTPEAFRFALDLSGLTTPEVTVWTARMEGRVAAIGALKQFGEGVGEVKSMRTHPDFLGRGAGAAILGTLIEAARARGLLRLSLETGTSPSFEAAIRLYRRYGFESGPPFGPYKATAHNQFFHLAL